MDYTVDIIICQIRKLYDKTSSDIHIIHIGIIKHLLDKAMADIEIYSGEQSNIRRGQRPSWILS